jgi:hypothetical protein
MIFDHLEDTVFAPDSFCLWCADTTCDGTHCSSAFDPHDFHEATTLFMQQLQPLVANAKLDRPLDSNPPLSRELMLTRLVADDWGDTADGTQYDQDDHWYTDQYDDASYHQEHQEHHEHDTEEHYHDTDPDEQAYMEDAHEHDQEHTQEAVSAGSEDDHQDE